MKAVNPVRICTNAYYRILYGVPPVYCCAPFDSFEFSIDRRLKVKYNKRQEYDFLYQERSTIMAVTISYDTDSRLQILGLTCDCPCEHSMPTQDIYVGTELLPKLPAYIKKKDLGTHCVLVCDKNTYQIAGRTVEQILKQSGFEVILCRILRENDVDPDETAVGEVLLSIEPETEFLISVGSGTLTDITRVNAMRTGLPFVSVGTAPSMDGYTSIVAPLLLRGLKIHRAAVCPEIIVCDLDILRTAPLSMVASGVGDVLGKYIAKADWKLGNIINNEPYCDVCGEIVTDAVNKLVENAEEIAARSRKGIRILIEALLLAGVTIMIVGHTRAVASIEHNVAHYWDMVQLTRGNKPPKHGSSVGVATLLVWPIFNRFAQEDLSRLDLDAIKTRRISRLEREQWMLKTYGEEGGTTIMKENEGDFLTWEEQERRIRRAQEHFDQIQAVIAELPDYDTICKTMQTLDAHMTPEEEGIDTELLNLSMHCAKDYRTRYSLFKLIDECGLTEEYLKDFPLPDKFEIYTR